MTSLVYVVLCIALVVGNKRAGNKRARNKLKSLKQVSAFKLSTNQVFIVDKNIMIRIVMFHSRRPLFVIIPIWYCAFILIPSLFNRHP